LHDDDSTKYSYQYVSEQILLGKGRFTPVNSTGGVDRDSSFKVSFTTNRRTVDVDHRDYVPEEVEGVLDWDISQQQLVARMRANMGGPVSQVPQYSASTVLGKRLPPTLLNRAIHVNAHHTKTPLFKGDVPDACSVGLMDSYGSESDIGVEFVRCAMTVEVSGDTSVV